MGFLSFLKRESPEIKVVLDIGTKAIKGLVLEEKKDKVFLRGMAKEYYDEYRPFFTLFFEKEILKTAFLSVISQLEKNIKGERVSLILNLGPTFSICKIKWISQKREKPRISISQKEKREILKKIEEKAKKEILREFSFKRGILAKDLQILDFKILEEKIDGYLVPDIQGYKGERIEVKVFLIFGLRDYLNFFVSPSFISNQIKSKRLIISCQINGLLYFLSRFKLEGFFLDVGGKITQILKAKNGKLKEVAEISVGGEDFSKEIVENLGISEKDARILKERYSERKISEDCRQRIKEFLEIPLKNWLNEIKEVLKESNKEVSKIFLFGGGSLLPEIKESLENENFEVDFLKIPDFNLPCQFLPCILSYYGTKSF